jgi:hypothetical protein
MWPFGKKDSFDQVLKTNLDNDFSLFACGENPPSIQAIKEFENTFTITLPKDFRVFSMSRLGGIYIEAKESVWPKPKPYEVGPFWSFLYGIAVYGFAAGIPEFMDIRRQTTEFREFTQTKHVPFMKIMGDANVYCFDETGSISQWDHETGGFDSVTMNFLQVFEVEVKALAERKTRKIAESQKAG